MARGGIGRSMITIRTGKKHFSKAQHRAFMSRKNAVLATQCQACLFPKKNGVCTNPSPCRGDRAQRRLVASRQKQSTS